jgi:hypothetical protein
MLFKKNLYLNNFFLNIFLIIIINNWNYFFYP